MAKAAMQAYRAAEKHDPEALLAAGEALNHSCDSCHRNYDVPVD
jgi:cytochrome c556